MANQTVSDLAKGLALGALNGAIYSAIQFILVSGYYDYLIRLDAEKMERAGLSPVQMTDMVDKRWVSVWFVLAFTIASFIWHRYSTKVRKSSILFWEAIGLSAIVGWNIIVLTLLWIERSWTGQSLGYERAISLSNPLFGPFSLGLVIVTNFIYGISIGILDKPSMGRGRRQSVVFGVGLSVAALASAAWAFHGFHKLEQRTLLTEYAASTRQEIPKLTLCELLADPHAYDLKLVRVEAILVVNNGDRSLYDPSCTTMEPMVGVEPDPSLWYESGGGVEKKFYDLMSPQNETKEARARMVMVGRFEGPNFSKDGRTSRFQHQLVLMRLEKAEPLTPDRTASAHQ